MHFVLKDANYLGQLHTAFTSFRLAAWKWHFDTLTSFDHIKNGLHTVYYLSKI